MTQSAVIAQLGGTDYSGTFRNKIINGAMVFNQRGSATYTSPANPTYTLDRWYSETNLTSQYTVGQNLNSITPPAGFSNYLGVLNGSAYSVTTSDYAFITQRIEGYNWADLAWGTSSAKTVTVSFWVYSSVTGTYSFSFENPTANNQSYNTTYSIPSANTWTYVSLTIPGSTTTTWNTSNSSGVVCRFSIGTANSTLIGSSNTWSSSRNISTTGAQSIFGTSASVWYITGVQIESGSSATPFERRPVGIELALCQRYYTKSYNIETAPGTSQSGAGVGNISWRNQDYSNIRSTFAAPVYYPVQMRTSPTVTLYSLPGTSGNYSVGSMPHFNDGTASAAYTTIYASGARGFAGVETGGIAAGQFFNFHYVAVAEL